MPKFAVIILAAGGSSRLGQPKQLVTFHGETLIRRAVRTAVESGADQVVVVLGAEAPLVWLEATSVEADTVEAVENPIWEAGMATSIRAGARRLRDDVDAVIILLCDTPLVTAELITELASAVSESEPLSSSEFDGLLGPPCGFHRSQLPRLMELAGDSGARTLLRNAQNVVRIPFEAGRLDIDSPADLTVLTSLEDRESR